VRLVKLVIIGIVLLSLIVSTVAGCQQPSLPGNFTDDLGRDVQLDSIPQRIVSLAPSNTEILFALGLEDKVVGVTEFCNYPDAAKAKPKIGGFNTVDIERVVALGPDLILAASIHDKTVIPALEKVGLTVFALAPKTLDEVLASIALAGEVTGKSQEATRLVTSLEQRIKAVTDKTRAVMERPRVLYLSWHDPLFTTGLGTIHHDLINKAGGENIAQDLLGHKTIDLETVIQRNPQVIIVNRGHGEAKDLPFSYVKNEPRLGVTEAVIAGRVYQIDADIIDRPTPRAVEALEQLVRFIHPELFSMHEEAK
jgi:iron complex transport system substrate-binding protein